MHVAVPTFAIISSILIDKRSMMSCSSLLKRNSLFGIVSNQNKCLVNYLWVSGITLSHVLPSSYKVLTNAKQWTVQQVAGS